MTHTTLICVRCGKPISTRARRYCSRSCANRARFGLAERDATLKALWNGGRGLKLEALARRAGISRQRVSQIVGTRKQARTEMAQSPPALCEQEAPS